jgi:hypothetical protein
MDLALASVTARAPSRAAQYVRMSTEHQQYSPENQLEIIRQYAGAHNMEIVQNRESSQDIRELKFPVIGFEQRAFDRVQPSRSVAWNQSRSST